MRNKIRLFISLIFLVALGVSYNNCSKTEFTVRSTSIGNPMAPVSSELLLGICGVINRCNPQVTLQTCQSALAATGGFSSPLGLPSVYDSFSAIIQAEQTGAIIGNAVSGASCYDSINVLSCGDATVTAAYNPAVSNPFQNAAGMIPSSSCDQSFSVGVNLEVPIELTDSGVASNLTAMTFSRTRTTLNPSDYDGTVTYSFEIDANNADNVTRNVSLVDSSGAVVASIPIPNVGGSTIWSVQRYQASFTPTAGASDYRLMLDGTNTAGQLILTAARVRVKQVGATKTKVYIPLIDGPQYFAGSSSQDFAGYVDTTTSAGYSVAAQVNALWYSRWKKNDSAFVQLSGSTPFTFEAVLSADPGSTAYASLFNSDTGLQVSASEISTSSSTPTLISRSLPDAAANFSDQNTMQIEIKEQGTRGYIYRAGLWISLTNLTHAEVYYRVLSSVSYSGSGIYQVLPYNRALINTTLFTSPSVYHELISSADPGTTCVISLFDSGSSDSGSAGSPLTMSSLTISSPTPNVQRSQLLNLTSGDRYTVYSSPNSGSGSCALHNSHIVIGF